MSEQTKVVYDPTKPYTWTPETEFVLRGGEFGLIFNLLVKEERELMQKLEAINLMKMKLKEAVEAGQAVEPPIAQPA